MDKERYWEIDKMYRKAVLNYELRHFRFWGSLAILVLFSILALGWMRIGISEVASAPMSIVLTFVGITAFGGFAIALLLAGLLFYDMFSRPGNQERWHRNESITKALVAKGCSLREIKQYKDLRLRGW